MHFKPLLLLVLTALSLRAQLPPPTNSPIIGARQPALSPDGKRLAFVYRGDIWISDARGGRATPITSHLETDATPLFSPDGNWLAFSSKRSGNWDIYVIPADGGRARQLTWHSGSDVPTGWSPDGKYLLFAGKRDSVNHSLFALDVNTGATRLLTEDYATINSANYSPDGTQVAYGRYGFPFTRPRYAGSAAAQIWLLDLDSGERHPLTTNQFQHLWPRFMPDGKILTVTVEELTPSSSTLGEPVSPIADNPRRTPNLWVYDQAGHAKQLTIFTGGAVRSPSIAAASSDIAFEYGPDLYLLKKGEREPQKLKLVAAADEKQTTRRREKATTGVTEAEPSPDGKTFAFGLQGEIWTISMEKPKGIAAKSAEYATRLTDWAGDDSDFSWSKDGKKLYFTSDREFYTRIYELDVKSRQVTPLWKRNSDVEKLRMSPDGTTLGFWVTGQEGGLYTMTLTNREVKKLVSVPGPQWRNQGGADFDWSPDMAWICYAHRGESKAWNLWIVAANGASEPRNITRLYAYHSMPAWSPDGKYLFFQSNRDGNGLYVLPLTREDVRVSDTDLKFVKSTNAVTVKIELEDIHRRIRKVASQTPQSGLQVTSEGQIVFITEGDIATLSYDGKDFKKVTSGGNKTQLRVSKDGKKAFFTSSGDLYSIKLDGGKEEKITFNAEWERNIRAERQAAFTQFWRSYERGFYDANFHGRDWSKIRSRYEPLLDAVETNDEFAGLLNSMIGELETSHAEVTAGTNKEAIPSPTTPHLGFTFDYRYAGPGLKVKGVPHASPGWYEKTRLEPGEIVLAINGEDVALNENLYKIINDKQDREFEFLVSTNGEKADARTIKYKALTSEEWTQLNYQNRVEYTRAMVERKSGGKVCYLHIASMGAQNHTQFEREAYEYIVGKESMIIDVRFNNGGNIADTLVEWLQRKPHGWLRPRDGVKEPVPFHAWDRKMVVLQNEHSYSNAEIFPSAMRAKGLAQLIGVATPGYVIWTDSLSLVDGTRARMPMTGAYRMDGTPMENNGEKPDIEVRLSPDDWLNDRDPQIDRAIEVLVSGAVAAQ
ncbi:MAG TPA: S41 family peptidase [Candidatus Limnocylindria bacterium]|nr:S41 family peptidase [Candidatus Limnocylindria bacterium]